jgi:hypothetical protein
MIVDTLAATDTLHVLARPKLPGQCSGYSALKAGFPAFT